MLSAASALPWATESTIAVRSMAMVIAWRTRKSCIAGLSWLMNMKSMLDEGGDDLNSSEDALSTVSAPWGERLMAMSTSPLCRAISRLLAPLKATYSIRSTAGGPPQ